MVIPHSVLYGNLLHISMNFFLLNDNTFVKNAEQIVKHISDAADSNNHKVIISSVTYELLKKSIDKLKDLRSHDYNGTEDNTKKSED